MHPKFLIKNMYKLLIPSQSRVGLTNYREHLKG